MFKKENVASSIIGIIFITMITVISLVIIFNIAVKAYHTIQGRSAKIQGVTNSQAQVEVQDEADNSISETVGETKLISITKIIPGEQIKSLESKIEAVANDSILGKKYFVDYNGLWHKLFLRKSMNGVIQLNNGMDYELYSDVEDKDIESNATSLRRLANYAEANGAEFIYVQAPTKDSKYHSQLKEPNTSYANSVADRLIKQLKNSNVHYIDLREEIENEGIDINDFFLSTEHHWNAYGGFYGFKKICDYIQTNYNEDLEESVLNIDNYQIKKYEKQSLGYYGQRTGCIFTPYEDFDLITPNFYTNQSCNIVHKEIVRKGSFEETVIDKSKLEVPLRDRDLYGLYIGGDFPLVINESLTAKNEGTILIFIDSFGVVPESFLTTAFKKVVAVDMRWVNLSNWGKKTTDYIDEYNPDYVIMLVNPNQIGPGAYHFDQ